MNTVRQAIVTKYLPCTNCKGSRIKAICDAGSVTISYPSELESRDAHAKAARMLHEKLGWNANNELLIGALPDSMEQSFVFIQIERKASK